MVKIKMIMAWCSGFVSSQYHDCTMKNNPHMQPQLRWRGRSRIEMEITLEKFFFNVAYREKFTEKSFCPTGKP